MNFRRFVELLIVCFALMYVFVILSTTNTKSTLIEDGFETFKDMAFMILGYIFAKAREGN